MRWRRSGRPSTGAGCGCSTPTSKAALTSSSHDALHRPTRAAGQRPADAQAAAELAASGSVRGRDRVRDGGGHPAGIADLTAACQRRASTSSMRRGRATGGGWECWSGTPTTSSPCAPPASRPMRPANWRRRSWATLGLRLHPEKTRIVHLTRGAEGFDFLGFHHQMRESWKRRGRWYLQKWPTPPSDGLDQRQDSRADQPQPSPASVEQVAREPQPRAAGLGGRTSATETPHGSSRPSTPTSTSAWRCWPAPSTDYADGTGPPVSHHEWGTSSLGVHRLNGTVKPTTAYASR